MEKFIINALSANGQCSTIAEAAAVLKNLMYSIYYFWPMKLKERSTLHFEPCSNNISLCQNENFDATVNNVRSIVGGDIPRKWYTYTKNQPAPLDANEVKITISPITSTPEQSISGYMIRDFITCDAKWLSFGGLALNETRKFRVEVDGEDSIEVANAHNELELQSLLPFFEHSGKHRKEPYFDQERKEQVAAMPIRNLKDAGNLLRSGIKVGEDIFSYDFDTRNFYRFKLTIGNKYHGFQVESNEVPVALQECLKR